MRPKISVIMSVYNGEMYLPGTIASILNQDFSDLEFIIIDDGSQDHSLKIINDFAEQDQRIQVIQNQKNQGLTRSLNRGIKQARGQYIARQDVGDISLPPRLKVQYAYLEKNDQITLTGTSAVIINRKGRQISRHKRKDHPTKLAKKLLRGNVIFHSSIVFRNQGISYREKFYFAQDYDLYLRLLSKGRKITNLPYFLIKQRYDPKSISFEYHTRQTLFAQIARDFYYQRVKYNQDNYLTFDPQIILKLNNRHPKIIPTMRFFLQNMIR